MFVFWYCHKRGRETRLARADAEKDGAADEEDDNDDEIEVENSDEDDVAAEDLEKTLQQPDPAQVPLPEGGKGREAV